MSTRDGLWSNANKRFIWVQPANKHAKGLTGRVKRRAASIDETRVTLERKVTQITFMTTYTAPDLGESRQDVIAKTTKDACVFFYVCGYHAQPNLIVKGAHMRKPEIV